MLDFRIIIILSLFQVSRFSDVFITTANVYRLSSKLYFVFDPARTGMA
jgi:hypothetical protein